MGVQITPAAEAATYRFNPFDLTKVRSHADARRYRVGINVDHLPVNRPHATEARTHSRDGYLYDGRHKGAKNYEPNSFDGPVRSGPDRPSAVGVPRGDRCHR